MGKSKKTSSSKKTFEETEQIFNEPEILAASNSSDFSDDDAPEAVSMSESKTEIISQIKSEREARRVDREKKRQRAVNLQEQQRQARERKAKEIEAVEDEISGKDENVSDNENVQDSNESNEICPLPENIFESALNQFQSQQQKQQNNRIRFDSSSEDDGEELPVSNEEISETIRLQRAKVAKKRLVDSLPFGVVEVGFNGRARITKAEIKARRKISKLKLESAGSQVRRIDSVLDRARKNRAAPAVFYRNNSFY